MLWLRQFVVLLLVFISCSTPAQQFPTRPIRVLIPFTPGSAADIIVRAMEPAMREKLGQSLVVDNRGGAGGNIAAEMCAKSTPDGYTIMMATIGTHAINHSLYRCNTFGQFASALRMYPGMSVFQRSRTLVL